eukprot:Partr_v1_DN26482_c1_g1_i2_m23682 putative ribophorin I
MNLFLSLVLLCTAHLALTDAKAASDDPADVKQDWINENIERRLMMDSHILRDRRLITARPTSSAAASKQGWYHFTAEISANASIAWVLVQQSGKKLDVTSVVRTPASDGRHVHLFKVLPVAGAGDSNKSTKLEINLAYVRALPAHPARIRQNQPQYVRFQGNVWSPSPYVVEKQTLTCLLSSSTVREYTKSLVAEGDGAKVTKSGKTITYGPIEAHIQPGAYQPLVIHYENNSPHLTLRSMSRELWLSHWAGKLSVEERLSAVHTGALLDGQFSRIDFTNNQQSHARTSAVKYMDVPLPEYAEDIYYRDDIGNVSTSALVGAGKGRRGSVMQVVPRYPLFGGWMYSWYHGYTLPLSEYLRVLPDGRFIFKAPMVSTIRNAPIEAFSLTIVLPEGATGLEFETAFEMDKVDTTFTYSYFDTSGRPTVYFYKEDLVDEHFLPFQITYSYSGPDKYRKPMVASAAIFLIFVLSMIYWRLDISYQKRSSGKKQVATTITKKD